MEGLPKHRQSSCRRSTMNYRSPSQTLNSSLTQGADVASPPSQYIARKIKGFIHCLIGKRIKKMRRSSLEEGYNGTLDDFSVRKLIRLYYKHENLYNPFHSYYGNKQFEEDCYNDMARSFPGKTGYELRSCIEDLRQQFEQEFRIIETARRGKGEVPAPTIRYFNEFLFLVPYLCTVYNNYPAEKGTSSQNPQYNRTPPHPPPPPTDLPGNKMLNNFTGFPLSAFPGILCCSPKEMKKRAFKKDSKKPSKKVRDQEKYPQDATFTAPTDQYSTETGFCTCSRVSLTSSHYGDEKDIKTIDLTCPWRVENSPYASESQLLNLEYAKPASTSKPQESSKPVAEPIAPPPVVPQTSMKSNSAHPSVTFQMANSCPVSHYLNERENAFKQQESIAESFASQEQEQFMIAHPPNSAIGGKEKPIIKSCFKAPLGCQAERKEAVAEDKRDNPSVAKYQHFKQVQMLCDMIRTELTATPDFIYFDAKWRIIEILREVHKRQLVHMKAGPQRNAVMQQLNQLKMQHHPYVPPKNSPSPPVKPGHAKISDHIKGSNCPYCPCQNK